MSEENQSTYTTDQLKEIKEKIDAEIHNREGETQEDVVKRMQGASDSEFNKQMREWLRGNQ